MLSLKALLDPFGIPRYYTDGWGTYERHVDKEQHPVGKAHMQHNESKHINLRTRIKRLVRRTICFSKTEHMHDLVVGLFVNRYEFGRGISHEIHNSETSSGGGRQSLAARRRPSVPGGGATCSAQYTTLLTLARPRADPLPDGHDVLRARPLIRHAADVPVLLSAMQSRARLAAERRTPAHFTPVVATRTRLRIATPRRFLQTLARGLG